MLAIIVCGGRSFGDAKGLFTALDRIKAAYPDMRVLQGAALGADSLAAKWAAARGVPCDAFPARWHSEGRAAGPKRNLRMLAHLMTLKQHGYKIGVVAFPGGRGTQHMIESAEAAGVKVHQPLAVNVNAA